MTTVIGDGNRLTVFVLPTDADVRKLAGDTTGFISGFYTGRATGSLALLRSGTAPKAIPTRAQSLSTNIRIT